MKYHVKNVYGIAGTSTHKTAKLACKAAKRRKGEGWIVLDDLGNEWDLFDGKTYISNFANHWRAFAIGSQN